MREALAVVAVAGEEPDPVLTAALISPEPVRRGAAGEALAQSSRAEVRERAKPLLTDADPLVRLRIAAARLRQAERDAVPVLIELLAVLPPMQAWQAEEALGQLAGDQAPSRPKTDDATARREYARAWSAWWETSGAKLQLQPASRRPPHLGYTLVVLLDAGRVLEQAADGTTRWTIDGLKSPLDARILPGERVLISEFGTRSVTERDFKGRILWQKQLNEAPTAAQRLPGGDTFIVTRTKMLEVRRDGSETRSIPSPGGQITAAERRPDGRITCVTAGGNTFLLDATGKEVLRYTVGGGVCTTSSVNVLPGGRTLLVDYSAGAIREHDATGKPGWEGRVARPISAARLPNGHTLVSSQDNAIVELDRDGKERARRPMPGHPTRVRSR